MRTSSALLRPSAAVLAAGGLCWVVKFVVIAASDGATSGTPDTATAVLYVAAVALMALGMAGLGAALLAGRHPVLRVGAALGGVVAWWLTYVVIDAVTKAVAGDAGPFWLSDEVGIITTGALLMSVGLLLLRAPSDRRYAEVAASG